MRAVVAYKESNLSGFVNLTKELKLIDEVSQFKV